MRRLALFLAVLCALPGAARGEGLVESPYDCPPKTRGIKHPHKSGFVCRTRLDIRDVFRSDKNPHDPCPEGYWWFKERGEKADPCLPIVCTTTEHAGDISQLCPSGMGLHAHENSGTDWFHPVQCVYNYKPQNLKTGGLPLKEGDCARCIINHAAGLTLGRFLHPKREEHKRRAREKKARREKEWSERRKKARREKQSRNSRRGKKHSREDILTARAAKRRKRIAAAKKPKPCPAGSYSYLNGCRKCEPDTMTVRRKDGATFCIGGPAQSCRGYGAPTPSGNAIQPYVCKPCDGAAQRVVVNGWIRCLAHVCSGDKLPVPLEEKGLADCVVPLERSKDKPK